MATETTTAALPVGGSTVSLRVAAGGPLAVDDVVVTAPAQVLSEAPVEAATQRDVAAGAMAAQERPAGTATPGEAVADSVTPAGGGGTTYTEARADAATSREASQAAAVLAGAPAEAGAAQDVPASTTITSGSVQSGAVAIGIQLSITITGHALYAEQVAEAAASADAVVDRKTGVNVFVDTPSDTAAADTEAGSTGRAAETVDRAATSPGDFAGATATGVERPTGIGAGVDAPASTRVPEHYTEDLGGVAVVKGDTAGDALAGRIEESISERASAGDEAHETLPNEEGADAALAGDAVVDEFRPAGLEDVGDRAKPVDRVEDVVVPAINPGNVTEDVTDRAKPVDRVEDSAVLAGGASPPSEDVADRAKAADRVEDAALTAGGGNIQADATFDRAKAGEQVDDDVVVAPGRHDEAVGDRAKPVDRVEDAVLVAGGVNRPIEDVGDRGKPVDRVDDSVITAGGVSRPVEVGADRAKPVDRVEDELVPASRSSEAVVEEAAATGEQAQDQKLGAAEIAALRASLTPIYRGKLTLSKRLPLGS